MNTHKFQEHGGTQHKNVSVPKPYIIGMQMVILQDF